MSSSTERRRRGSVEVSSTAATLKMDHHANHRGGYATATATATTTAALGYPTMYDDPRDRDEEESRESMVSAPSLGPTTPSGSRAEDDGDISAQIFQLGMEAVEEGLGQGQGQRRGQGQGFGGGGGGGTSEEEEEFLEETTGNGGAGGSPESSRLQTMSDAALFDENEENSECRQRQANYVPVRHCVVPPRDDEGGFGDDVSSLHYQNMTVASYGDHRAHWDKRVEAERAASSPWRQQHRHHNRQQQQHPGHPRDQRRYHQDRHQHHRSPNDGLSNAQSSPRQQSPRNQQRYLRDDAKGDKESMSPRQQKRNPNGRRAYVAHREKMEEKRMETTTNSGNGGSPRKKAKKINDEKAGRRDSREKPSANRHEDEGRSQGCDDNDNEEEARRRRKKAYRNAAVVALFVLLLCLVALVGAGVGFAMRGAPTTTDGYEYGAGEEGDDYGSGPAAVAGDASDDGFGVGSRDDGTSQIAANDGDPLFAPTPSPSRDYDGPCYPVELGVIFDRYPEETSWTIVVGNHYPEDPERDVAIWGSPPEGYDPAVYAMKADAFRECLPEGYYTFVLSDSGVDGMGRGDEGDRGGGGGGMRQGRYVLSSQGRVIAVGGGEATTASEEEETVPFRLPYEDPGPIDADNDGRDDRLGTMLPYDSSSMVEGVDCENFRLVIATDRYGVETTWELFEEGTDNGGDENENLIADGGPYAGEYTYVVDYCLRSPARYVLRVYDWDRRGLCCETGRGWYRAFSGDAVLRESDGRFGEVEETRFRLPVVG